ncbi:hypothetical protein Cni_G28666 [Canna indica]|uniref:Uncharacterized protein n=1 Tax=Canna indica TaxID=4628 RepID=A0AAQ3L3E9_9LILI|nr:hypothetical protein Cni_G28666 [Canna indica]
MFYFPPTATKDMGGSVSIWHQDHCSHCCQRRCCTIRIHLQGDGGHQLSRPTTQQVRLPREHPRCPLPSPFHGDGIPLERRRMQRRCPRPELAAAGAGGVLQSLRSADEDHPIDEQPRSTPLEATSCGSIAAAGAVAGGGVPAGDAGYYASARAERSTGGDGEGSEGRRVWARGSGW